MTSLARFPLQPLGARIKGGSGARAAWGVFMGARPRGLGRS